MPHLLIVESDTPRIEAALKIAGRKTSAGSYVRAFQSISEKISYDIVRPYTRAFSPASVDFSAFDGFVFTGSRVSWSVDAPEALPLRQTMEATLKVQKPVFGSCNGLQLGNVILGGACCAAPMGMEIGLARNIMLSSAGQSHPLHHGRTDSFCALSIHRDQVSKTPGGAIVTAGNAHSSVQAMIYEQQGVRFWGTQYHPEFSLTDIMDCVSDTNSLFYSEHGILADLQSAKQSRGDEAAKILGVSGDDLSPRVRQTELRNWLQILD